MEVPTFDAHTEAQTEAHDARKTRSRILSSVVARRRLEEYRRLTHGQIDRLATRGDPEASTDEQQPSGGELDALSANIDDSLDAAEVDAYFAHEAEKEEEEEPFAPLPASGDLPRFGESAAMQARIEACDSSVPPDWFAASASAHTTGGGGRSLRLKRRTARVPEEATHTQEQEQEKEQQEAGPRTYTVLGYTGCRFHEAAIRRLVSLSGSGVEIEIEKATFAPDEFRDVVLPRERARPGAPEAMRAHRTSPLVYVRGPDGRLDYIGGHDDLVAHLAA